MRTILLSFTLLSIFTTALFAQTPVDVAENTFKVQGLGEEVFYYGFAEGDQLIFNFEEVNGKELKEMEIIELPTNLKYMDYKVSKIEDKKITINNTGVYKFRFANSAISGRICKYRIQRVQASESTKNFKTEVYWKTVYDTTYTTTQEKYLAKREYKVERLAKEKGYINSGSNALFEGGKSRIAIPIDLPNNTVEWYYTFSASRNAKEVEKTHSEINLLGELTKLVDPTGVLNIGVGMLTTPPGGNVCEIYLLDNQNRASFEAKTQFNYFLDASRENISSGIVQVKRKYSNCFLGIKNPSSTDGIHFTLEVAAITLNEQWGMKDVTKNNITSKKVAYLKN